VVVETSLAASDFSALQADLAEGRTDRMRYYVFDLLHLDGRDLTPLPLVERKRLLSTLSRKSGDPIRSQRTPRSDKGEIVLRHACRMGLEGIVSKLRDSPYRSGRGTVLGQVEMLGPARVRDRRLPPSTVSPKRHRVAGDGRLCGRPLRPVGRVGTGFSVATAEALMTRLKALETDQSPFDPPLSGLARRGVRYVRPELVAEVDFRAWTGDGNLRHAAFRGLREDKDAREVTGEGLPETPSTRCPKG
jgi:bifunctional non-homologous end joining protein LigD